MDEPINITLSISFVCIRFQKLIAGKEHLPHVISNSQAKQNLQYIPRPGGNDGPSRDPSNLMDSRLESPS